MTIVGNRDSVFVEWTAMMLSRNGVHVTIASQYSAHYPFLAKFGFIGRLLERFLSLRADLQVKPTSDTVFILALTADILWMVPYFKLRFSRVLGQTYGSDILRRNKRIDRFFGYSLGLLDAVSAQNEVILSEINRILPADNLLEKRILKFGLPTLDEIDTVLAGKISDTTLRRKLGFAENSIIVSLGYSPAPGQRQEELIKYFCENLADFPDVQFAVPAQYGSDQRKAEVAGFCALANEKSNRTDFVCLTEFLDLKQIALFRKLTDVLINHSVTDAFSGSVQETIYAGNFVLAGAHLPYRDIPGFDLSLFLYDGIENCSRELRDLVKTLAEKKLGLSRELTLIRSEIRRLSGEEEIASEWVNFIEGKST